MYYTSALCTYSTFKGCVYSQVLLDEMLCYMLQLTVVLEVQVVGVVTIGVALRGDLDSHRHRTARGRIRVRAMKVR